MSSHAARRLPDVGRRLDGRDDTGRAPPPAISWLAHEFREGAALPEARSETLCAKRLSLRAWDSRFEATEEPA